MNEENQQEHPEETPEAPLPQRVERQGERRSKAYGRLGVISFGLATGVTFAVFVFFLGIMAAFFEWGMVLAATLSSFLVGRRGGGP